MKYRCKTFLEMQSEGLLRSVTPEEVRQSPLLAVGKDYVELDPNGRLSRLPAPLRSYGQPIFVSDFWSEAFPFSFGRYAVSEWEFANCPWRFKPVG